MQIFFFTTEPSVKPFLPLSSLQRFWVGIEEVTLLKMGEMDAYLSI